MARWEEKSIFLLEKEKKGEVGVVQRNGKRKERVTNQRRRVELATGEKTPSLRPWGKIEEKTSKFGGLVQEGVADRWEKKCEAGVEVRVRGDLQGRNREQGPSRPHRSLGGENI